jgi:hypothetical protein
MVSKEPSHYLFMSLSRFVAMVMSDAAFCLIIEVE